MGDRRSGKLCWLFRGVMCVALLAAVFATASVSAQSDRAPYLYYFSPDLNAFVIERADGSQSRLIGPGLADIGTDSASGAWSPSGKYFAWTTSTWAGPGNVQPRVWIVSADGAERLTMLDNLRDVDQFAWSPTEDLLFVVDTHQDGALGASYYLINVDTRELITSFSLYNWMGDFYHSRFRWAPDGSLVVLFYDISNRVNGEWTARRYRRAVSRTGEIDDAPIGATFDSLFRVAPTFSAFGDFPYFAVDEERLTVENVASGTTRTYDMPGPRYFSAIHWSPHQSYALLASIRYAGSQPYGELWLLTDDGLTQVADRIRYYEYNPPSFWTASGDLAHYVTLDGTLHIFDPETLEATPVPDIENVEGASWSADGRLLYVVPSEPDAPADLYDVQTRKSTLLRPVQLYGNIGGIVSSPDSRFFAVGRAFAILDIRERKLVPLDTHERAMIGYYDWHPGSEWLIYNQMLYAAGGGIGPIFSAVTRSDGSMQRDLSQGFSYAQWLPENVVPHLSADVE